MSDRDTFSQDMGEAEFLEEATYARFEEWWVDHDGDPKLFKTAKFFYEQGWNNAIKTAKETCLDGWDWNSGGISTGRQDECKELADYFATLLIPNVEFSGGAPLHGAASAGTQG